MATPDEIRRSLSPLIKRWRAAGCSIIAGALERNAPTLARPFLTGVLEEAATTPPRSLAERQARAATRRWLARAS